MEHDKKFVIIGNKNAVTYTEIFPYIRENKMWVGYTPMGKETVFGVPEEVGRRLVASGRHRSYTIVNGVVMGRAQSCWFTNLDIRKRHEELILYKKHSPDEYPAYDNFDAIEVQRTDHIPMDYAGVMGVPISFLDKYNPDQFEIIGSDYDVKTGLLPDLIKPGWHGKVDRAYLNGQRMYARLFIKLKKVA